MNDAVETQDTAAIEAAVLERLRAAPEPAALGKIQQALPKKPQVARESVARALEELVEQGRAFLFAPYRGKDVRYWDRGHDEYARQVIREALAKKPRTATELDKTLQKPLADWNASQRRAAAQQFAAQGGIYQLPPLPGGKTVRYGLTRPDPADYLRTAMGRFLKAEASVRKLLAPLGISPEEVRTAAERLLGGKTPERGARVESPVVAAVPTAPEDAGAEREAVLQKIRELARDPRLGGFVSLPDLRREMRSRVADKERFDQIVCELASRQVVELYPHDYPASLPEEERNHLVADGRGAFYNGVSLRGAAY